MQIVEVFKSAIFLSFFVAWVNKNRGQFALSLLFERVVFFQLDGNDFENGNRSNESNDGNESKVEFDIKKRYVYKKDKKLL